MHTKWCPDLSQSHKPKYKALFVAIEAAIKSEELLPGVKLPPIREIAFQLGMTPSTVVRAYQIGIDSGVLEAKVGDGTYVKSSTSKAGGLGQHAVDTYDDIAISGYNLRSSAAPRVGQDSLLCEIIGELASRGEILANRYTSHAQYDQLREVTATFLTREGIECDAKDIVLTKGATNATSMAARILSNKGHATKALTEPECYIGFRDVERIDGIQLISVNVDEEGICPDHLSEICAEYSPNFLMTSSILQNPYCITMTDERMMQIAKVAKEFDLHIIDDILHIHLVDGSRKSLRDFAPEHVWTVTSLSKLGYQSLQFGMLLPPKDRIEEVELYVSARSTRPSEIQRPIVEALLNSKKFDDVVRKTREEIKMRHEILAKTFTGISYQYTEGAPFLWLPLPAKWPASRFISDLASLGISVASADTFSAHNAATNSVRVTFGGTLSRDDFEYAIGEIARIVKSEKRERVI